GREGRLIAEVLGLPWLRRLSADADGIPPHLRSPSAHGRHRGIPILRRRAPEDQLIRQLVPGTHPAPIAEQLEPVRAHILEAGFAIGATELEQAGLVPQAVA